MSDPEQQERIAVVLPDGSELDVQAGATLGDVAHAIGPGLGRDAVAGSVDGDLVALAAPVHDGARVEVVTADSEAYREVLRHSAAHCLAQAVCRLYDDPKLAIGPPTDDGFYYDFGGLDLDEADLERIEGEMAEIIEADYDVEREEVPIEAARRRLRGQPYKLELLEDLAAENETVTFYRQGEWADLCAGPHVASTGEVGAVKLLEIAGAYWRGDETNSQLTRVYGTAFEDEGGLAAFLERREEAKRRDHRRIGREQDLFSVPEHSPGCAHFHPKGMVVRRELESYVREHNDALGYEEVWTPELNKADLWKTSGHYDEFQDNGEMFVWEQDGEEYGLKPMNCANHAHLYDRRQWSYRDLPVRYSEFGTVYRNEQSGELSGLLRVRGLTQDDGHAFLRPDQLEAEVRRTLSTIEEMYDDFGLEAVYKLETRGENAIGSDGAWNRATDALVDALAAEDLDYETEEGEAAFYGPKIGLDVRDAIGREWTIGTVQVDFNVPERYELTYVGEDNDRHRPVMLHRALLGSFDRFLGVLIEHVAGQFPTWLAPEQVRVLPVSDAAAEYAREVAAALSAFRVAVDDDDETLQRRIRAGHDDEVPYMLVVGEDEAAARTVSVRDRRERQAGDVPLSSFVDALREEVASKRIDVGIVE